MAIDPQRPPPPTATLEAIAEELRALRGELAQGAMRPKATTLSEIEAAPTARASLRAIEEKVAQTPDRRWVSRVLALFTAANIVFSRVQLTGATHMPVNWLSNASEGMQIAGSIVLALYAFFSALSLGLGFVGRFYPPALAWAQKCSNIGLRLHNVGLWLGSLMSGGRDGAARGFVTVRAMWTLVTVTWLAVIVSACVLAKSAPDLSGLGLCEANVAATTPGLDFVSFLAASIAKCADEWGATIEDLLNAILTSKDPSLAKYQSAALAAKSSPQSMAALRTQLGGHR